MELYTATSYDLARLLTKKYSTSFSSSTDLISASLRPAIFAIYGLVRIGDEIVDTYPGQDRATQLDNLEQEVYAALKRRYSTNSIVHAFVDTATQFGITKALIAPFFESMRMDLAPFTSTPKLYARYIYGSAEVVGLMCLKVFCEGDDSLYAQLEPGAKALGSAYQKVNFLRDIASDYQERGRVYFPGVSFETFDEADKQRILADCAQDFTQAKPAIDALPRTVRKAVLLSYLYYHELLRVLTTTPASTLTKQRIRVPDYKKLAILARVRLGGNL